MFTYYGISHRTIIYYHISVRFYKVVEKVSKKVHNNSKKKIEKRSQRAIKRTVKPITTVHNELSLVLMFNYEIPKGENQLSNISCYRMTEQFLTSRHLT